MQIRVTNAATNGTKVSILNSFTANDHAALTIPAYWRGVNLLANNLASFPRGVYDKEKNKLDHYLDRFLERRPNQLQTATVFWRTLAFHAVHAGNGYARITRTPTGQVTGLYNLLPEDVVPFRAYPLKLDDKGNVTDEFDLDIAKATQWYHHKPSKSFYPTEDILHVPGLGYDGMVGYSPIDLMADAVRAGKTNQLYRVRYLEKGTIISGSIELPAEATEEEAEQIIDTLENFKGTEAERDVVVLKGGAKLNNQTLTPAQSQLIEQAQFSTKEFAQILGVDPQFLFEYSEAKYSSDPEQRGTDLVRFTFRPWLDVFDDQLTAKLPTIVEQERGVKIKLNPDALLRGNTATQTSTVIAQVGGGLITKNEGRDALGKPADDAPESDTLLTPHAVASAPTTKTENAATPPVDVFAELRPLLDQEAVRIETRTTKAFGDVEKKTGSERTVWANVFADQQAQHVATSFAQLAVTLDKLTGRKLDAAKLGDAYAFEIRKRAAGQTPRTLGDILGDQIDGN